MDRQPDNTVNELTDCAHELCFQIKGENENRLVVCLKCANIKAVIDGAEIQGHIKAIDPIIWAFGELVAPFVNGGQGGQGGQGETG